MRTFIFLLLACFAVAASTDPVIVAHPAALADGQVLGANFGKTPGFLFVRPIVKLTDSTRAQGIDEHNRDRIYGSLAGSLIAVPVKKWTDVTIEYSITSAARKQLFLELVQRAVDKGFTLTAADFEFKFQVARHDGRESNLF